MATALDDSELARSGVSLNPGFGRLRALGRREGEDFTYVEWDDEGHGSVDIQAKIRRFSLVLDWLSETLAA